MSQQCPNEHLSFNQNAYKSLALLQNLLGHLQRSLESSHSLSQHWNQIDADANPISQQQSSCQT